MDCRLLTVAMGAVVAVVAMVRSGFHVLRSVLREIGDMEIGV